MVRIDFHLLPQFFPSTNPGMVLIFQPSTLPKLGITRHVHAGDIYLLAVWNMNDPEILLHIPYEILELFSIPNACKGLQFRDFDHVWASQSGLR